jgi:N-formylglutamate deformylase
LLKNAQVFGQGYQSEVSLLMRQLAFPPWAVLHIPHESTHVPDEVRSQFVLSDDALKLVLQRMTDHFTHEIFVEPHGEAAVVRAPVSRLVVDVERFIDDAREPMATRGMGVLYEVTSHLKPLRERMPPAER